MNVYNNILNKILYIIKEDLHQIKKRLAKLRL